MPVRRLLVLVLLLLPGALHAEATPAEKAGFTSRLTIYLAKGAPDACGPGCDRWIAIEGQIDRDAAPRVRRFLAGVKDTQRPIYLYSPGGSVEPSYEIGRLLRSRKAVARVGRTIATACGAASQVDAACLKLKNAGGEVEAELTTYHAVCNSACGSVFIGATSREVAPDAALAVHDSKLVLKFRGNPPPQMVAEARRRRMSSAARDRAAFIAAMGVSRELDELIRTVKFENLHMLTRDELYRFGIDTRPLAETTWRLEKEARPFVRKFVVKKQDNGTWFRMMEWRLSCESYKRVPLMFAGEIDEASVGKREILMTADAEPGKKAGGLPLRSGKFEIWRANVDRDLVNAMLASRALHFRETTSLEDNKTDITSFDIAMTGLSSAWAQLKSSCSLSTLSPISPWPATVPNLDPTPPAVPAP